MEVEYRLERSDLDEIDRARLTGAGIWKPAPPHERHPGTLVSCVTAGFLLTGFILSSLEGWMAGVVVVPLLVILWATFGVQVARSRIARHRLEALAARGSWRMILGKGGLVVVEPTGQDEEIAWEEIEAIVRVRSHVLFLLERRGDCYLVPRRAFPDDESFDDFVSLARGYRSCYLPTFPWR